MKNKIFCISVDLINADKPPASLAFLAGACEATHKNYICVSLNHEFLSDLSADDYNKVYSAIKLDSIGNHYALLDNTLDRVIKNIENFNPDAILLTAFSFIQRPLLIYFLTRLKTLRKSKKIEILAGGPGIDFETPDGQIVGTILANQDLIDYYCLGEGDTVILNWLNGQNNILGINSKKDRFVNRVPQIENLDQEYLIPSYKKIVTKNYKNLEYKQSTVYTLITSRGCVRNCAFCDVAKSWPKFRYRSGKEIANEIVKHHRDVGAVHFTLGDSLINGSLKSFNEFNQSMIEVKKQYPTLAEFSYNGMFIVRDKKSHSENFFRSMKEAGCESLAIGVETGSERLRFEMNKKFTNDDLDYHLEMCEKYGIENFLLTFVGYPTETEKDFELTCDMLERYQKYLISGTIKGINHSGIFSLLPNTPIYESAEEQGIVIINHKFADRFISWENTQNLKLTVKERIRRDLIFRKKALDLRYPIPYSDRYLTYIKDISPDFNPVTD